MPDRQHYERRLETAIAQLLREYGDLATRSPSRLPWKLFERELAETIAPELQEAYVYASMGLAGSLEGFELPEEKSAQAAQRWAERYSEALAKEVVGTTRDRLDKARKQQDQAATAAVILLLFGDDRARMIGMTEGTRAFTTGEVWTAKRFESATGEELIPIWRTSLRENVCDVCRPLEGARPEYWRRFFLKGPPAHPRCLCELKWERAALRRAA